MVPTLIILDSPIILVAQDTFRIEFWIFECFFFFSGVWIIQNILNSTLQYFCIVVIKRENAGDLNWKKFLLYILIAKGYFSLVFYIYVCQSHWSHYMHYWSDTFQHWHGTYSMPCLGTGHCQIVMQIKGGLKISIGDSLHNLSIHSHFCSNC